MKDKWLGFVILKERQQTLKEIKQEQNHNTKDKSEIYNFN